MPADSSLPHGLHFIAETPVRGLAVAERRVAHPDATIICAHGGLDRGGSFARLARRTERFDFVTYDRRGYQGSRDLQPLGLAHHIQDLLALVRDEASRGPVILFGHSFGGVVALGAAIAEPSLAQLVVVYEAPLPWILRRHTTRTPLTDDPSLEAERFFRRVVSNDAWDRLSELQRDARRADGPALVSDLTGLHGHAEPFDMSQLSVRAYYLYGDGPLTDYYRSLCVELRKVNPDIDSRELANASHGAHLTAPDQLATLIAELWDDTCASA